MNTTNLAAESNFLVPNATFIAELVAFVIILFVLGKWVVPPINKVLSDRQAKIRKQYDDLEQATADARAAEEKYRSQIGEARHEAARIREEAREQAQAIIDDGRSKAQEESERILRQAHLQLDAERKQVVHQLRNQVGTMATTLAGRIVGETLDDDARRDRTVERFLASLEGDASATEPVP